MTTSGKQIFLQKRDCIFFLFSDIDLPRFKYAGLVIGTGSVQSHISEVIALSPKVDAISSFVIPQYGSRVGPIFLNTAKVLLFRKIFKKTFISYLILIFIRSRLESFRGEKIDEVKLISLLLKLRNLKK